jgi:hypothetical protein
MPRIIDAYHPEIVRVIEDQGASFPEVARFLASDVRVPGEPPNSLFGGSLAVRGDLMLVGAPRAATALASDPGTPLSSAGNAYVFHRSGGKWRYAARLRGTASDAFPLAANNDFGSAVGIDGTTAVVAAEYDETSGLVAGALFFVDLSGN